MFNVSSKFAPGQQVTIKALKVTGWVYQVLVMEHATHYDCFWWFDGERRSSVLTEGEIDAV